MLKFIRRFLLVLFVLTGLFFALSPILVPWVVERSAQSAFSKSVTGELSIERTSFNPFTLKLEIEGTRVNGPDGKRVAEFAKLRLDVAWRSVWAGHVDVEEVALLSPDIFVELTADGSPKILQMLKPSETTEVAEEEVGEPLIVQIAQIVIEGGQLEVQDSQNNTLKTGEINLTAKDITTEAGKALNLSELLVPLADGRLSITGEIKHSPLELDIRIEAERLPVVNIAALAGNPDFKVKDGLLSGSLTLKRTEVYSAVGNIELESFAIETQTPLKKASIEKLTIPAFSADTENSSLILSSGLELVGFSAETNTSVKQAAVQALTVDEFLYDFAASEVSVGPVRIDTPELIIDQNQKTVNEAAEVRAEKDTPLEISLAELKVQNGAVIYVDSSLPGDHQVDVTELNVLLTDVKAAEAIETAFDVSAVVAGESPFTAKGNLKQSDTLSLEGKFVLDKLSHQVVSPYTEAFIGRSSEEGGLYIDMDYKITENQMNGKNTLLFDRWSWGNTLDGYKGDAVPVDMAFALLQDSHGRVNMNIPVEGDLNDPNIKIGALVRKATANVVTKLVSSPFKLLGSLIPGGKSDLDLTKVKFEASAFEMAPLEKAKLDALAVALKERPRLKLELAGEAYQASDLLPPLEEDGEPIMRDEVALKKLAVMRADSVYQLLLEQGVGPDRLIKTIPKVGVSKRKRSAYVRLKLIK